MTSKFKNLVLFVIIYVANSTSQSIYKGNEVEEVFKSGVVDNVKFTLVPRADESFELMSMDKADCGKEDRTVRVTFQLYTKRNRNEPEHITKNDVLSQTKFDPKKPTRFITHGWRNSAKSRLNQIVRNAILDNCDCNVFVVDWSKAAGGFNYISSRRKVPSVASKIAEFIDYLNTIGGLSFKDLTLIGHSLGAHISGLTGQKVRGGKVAVIIGLDPALPLFFCTKPNERLSLDDAVYVETIHTNAGRLGFRDPVGISSFYPNWGKKQPGCGLDLLGSCAHSRSYEYYAESLYPNNSFVPFNCLNYEGLKKGQCKLSSEFRMGGDPAHEGYPKGVYYVPTNKKVPYAKGLKLKN